jgi:hypothetical protein
MERIVHDYGLDASMTTYNRRGEVENGVVWMQVKGTAHPQRVRNKAALAFRVLRQDLVFWMGERYPVIFVLYDAKQERAYWLHIQDAFRSGRLFGLPKIGSRLTIHIPLAQAVNQEVIQRFRQLKAGPSAK